VGDIFWSPVHSQLLCMMVGDGMQILVMVGDGVQLVGVPIISRFSYYRHAIFLPSCWNCSRLCYCKNVENLERGELQGLEINLLVCSILFPSYCFLDSHIA